MGLAATDYRHIVLDDQGVPHIAGTNTKVVEVVLQVRAYGLSPEELHLELPHLGVAQIHSALAYYWDHRESLEADIERRRQEIEAIGARVGRPAVLDRLRRSSRA